MVCKGRSMALASGKRRKDHQAKIGIFGQRKAKRQFCHAGQLAIQKQPQAVRTRWVAVGRAGGEDIVNLFWSGVLAQPKFVIICRRQKQGGYSVAVLRRIKRADQSLGHMMAFIVNSIVPLGFFQVTLSPGSAPISARASGECALIRPKLGSASSSPVIS